MKVKHSGKWFSKTYSYVVANDAWHVFGLIDNDLTAERHSRLFIPIDFRPSTDPKYDDTEYDPSTDTEYLKEEIKQYVEIYKNTATIHPHDAEPIP